MIANLAPIVAGQPHAEARAILIDLVAIAFFAPATEACEELDAQDDAEFLLCEVERAFSAALRAGEVGDQYP
ncbi:hypothetical protein [Streptomyces sp. NPDC087300]|uniref:hypothetical protein n=1 Tax=Streptomyces sp. NPDC087300 TaxID=3365780 RepID=UPI003826F767